MICEFMLYLLSYFDRTTFTMPCSIKKRNLWKQVSCTPNVLKSTTMRAARGSREWKIDFKIRVPESHTTFHFV